MTHGLPFLRDWRTDADAPGWSSDFDVWASEVLSRGAVDEMIDFRNRAPGMPYAHPTIEHFAPMFVTLGAADDIEAAPDQRIDGFWIGLSKRSFQVA
jgi:4,5-DOPA dioxygenase extradiol